MKVRQPMLFLLDAFLLDGDSITFSDHIYQRVITAPLPMILLSKNGYRYQQLIEKRHSMYLPPPTNSNDLTQAMRMLEEGVP